MSGNMESGELKEEMKDETSQKFKESPKSSVKAKQKCDDEEMEVEAPEVKTLAYVPGRSRPLKEDEELVMDKTAYRMFFELQVESASLSFDILLDNLGFDRSLELNGEAVSACLIAGTEASKGIQNKLVVMRLSNMIPYHRNEESKEEQSDSEEDSSSEDDLDEEPDVEAATIIHSGTVNRVRAKQHMGRYLAASWSENKKIFIWDLTRPLTAVNDSAVMGEYTRHNESPQPLFTFKGHQTEGFALDWSPHPNAVGHLASGDCNGCIHYWTPRTSDWCISSKPYAQHTNSVEDIQWSPTEPTVFISVSADRSIRVWDTRAPVSAGSMLAVPEAHPADINVASWNRLNPTNLLTGGDDGSLRIWDLRLVQSNYGAVQARESEIPAYTHMFDYHNKPITSVEWHPTDSGVFVATCEDNQVTFWDCNLEQAEQELNESQELKATNSNEDVNLPVQLLFVHSGQNELKEAHWHPQIPGLVLTTSLDGYNVFRTCNI